MPRVVNRQRIYRGAFASDLGRREGFRAMLLLLRLTGLGDWTCSTSSTEHMYRRIRPRARARC